MSILLRIKNRLISKTYLTALGLGIITMLDMNSGFISSQLPEAYKPLLLGIWPLTMMTLREMTTSAVDKDTDETTK